LKTFSTKTLINARSDAIWSILTDAPRYPDWDTGVERIEGRIASGEKIKVFSKLSPGRAFPIKVTEIEPGRGMKWSSGMPLGLFKGERTFRLTPQADGQTEFFMEEIFSGVLLPLIGRSLPDFGPIFEQFAADLKRRAESAG
jgi:hypothetical protein